MQLHFLLVIVVVSDVKVMSSTVAVIFAIAQVVNNYNIQTEPQFFWTKPNQTHSERNPSVFKKPKPNRNLKKYIPHIPTFCIESEVHWNPQMETQSWTG